MMFMGVDMDIQKEREAFELNVSPVIWKRIEYNAENNIYMAKSKYWTSNIIQAVANEIDFGWKMWQLAKAQAVQEGFALVSKEKLHEWKCMARRSEELGCPDCYESRGYSHNLAEEIEAREQNHD